MGTFGDLFLGLLAILFPPIAVWIKRGICSLDSLLNILLCVLGYLPGLIHAWYIIAKYPDEYERLRQADENGRVSYYYVSREQGQQHRQAGSGAPDGGRAHREQQRSYGTTGSSERVPQIASQPQQGNSSGQPQAGSSSAAGEQGKNPPTYAEAVKGDNKVQTS